MTLVCVGVSHRTASLAVLDRLALGSGQAGEVRSAVLALEPVTEVVVVATCNRVEVFAAVTRFHAAVEGITAVLAAVTGMPVDELAGHLNVRYEDQVVGHLFALAAGLDSMVLGEGQILGQVRTALRDAQGDGAVAGDLGALVQQALRVGKRVQSQTGVGATGRSMVGLGLDLAAGHLGLLAGRRAAVVGAGSMAALAVATLAERGAVPAVVVNRTAAAAERLAAAHGGRGLGLDRLAEALGDVDLVVACTGATDVVVGVADLASAQQRRSGRPLVVLDVALPHDVDPAVRAIPGVRLISLADLAAAADEAAARVPADPAMGAEPAASDDFAAAVARTRAVVADEVAAVLTRRREQAAAPAVSAMRSRAEAVAAAELTRLDRRVPDLDDATRAEVAATVRRVVEKLLHLPTTRVRQMAADPESTAFAEAVRVLFDLGEPAAAVPGPRSLADARALPVVADQRPTPDRVTPLEVAS